MQNEIFDIIKEAQKALEQLENGKLYTSAYVCERFIKSAEENPHDLLINNMRNVVLGKLQGKQFVSQAELTDIYDQMIGLGGGHSAFREELGDFLTEKRQYVEPTKTASALRADREGGLTIDPVNQELSDAFATAFGFGKDNSFGTYSPQQTNMVNKVVIAGLTAEGQTPSEVEIISENDHFVLVAALYNDGFNKVAVHVPVQISGGIVQPPTAIVQGEGTVPLTKESLWLAIKEARDEKKHVAQQKFASQRTFGTAVKVAKQVVPASLEKFAQFETTLISASTIHSARSVAEAVTMVSDELKSFGAFNPQVKVATASDTEIVFNAHVPTEKGMAVVKVPVEIHNDHPNLPSRFAAATSDVEQVYDFSQTGYARFLSDVKGESRTIKVARQTGELSTASYHELNDMMLKGIATKDYTLAENALSVIQNRFDSSQFKAAFDKFTQLLKHSSTDQGSDRAKLIEAAVQRGDLIKHSTTVELYCPKLALPLSKIAFDEQGRVVPARTHRARNANEEEIFISSYDIKFS